MISLHNAILLLLFSSISYAQNQDVFGIEHLMPSAESGLQWDTRHWSEGNERSRAWGEADPFDARGWGSPRGDFNLFTVDGEGVLRMGGNQPRIYIQGTNENPAFFRDVEFTGYFRRIGNDGASNGGMIMGVRTDPSGHGNDNCKASTYYFGVRYPGSWVFYKELTHPLGANGASGRYLPNGETMPENQWIGVKFLCYNIPGTDHVQIEGYIELESNGDTSQAIAWTKIAEITDDGSWTVPVGQECGYAGNTIITEGLGSALMRNTDAAEANYKMVSIREIDPEGSFEPICEPVSASADDGNVPANALDDDLSTRWSAEGEGEYLQFCFEEDSIPLNGIQIAFYNGDRRATSFDIIGLVNDEDWFSIVENQTSSGTSLELEPFGFAETQWVKKLRIVGKGNSVNDWNSITEVKLDTASIVTNNSYGGNPAVSIFPTLAEDEINIRSQEKGRYQILNTKGQVLKTGTATAELTKIGLSDLPVGAYSLQFTSKQYVLLTKFFKR